MSRKRIKDDLDNPDRWLVSYADFITLMFAFFVMLYSVSSVQEKKLFELSQSVGAALGISAATINTAEMESVDSALIEAILQHASPITIEPINLVAIPTLLETFDQPEIIWEDPNQSRQHEQQQFLLRQQYAMNEMVQQLEQNLSSLITEGKIHIVQSNWGISIEINASLLFAPAEAKLNKESRKTLQSIADVLKNQNYSIRVEGHTDDKPIQTPMFPSNWELSSARATGVVRLLIALGIDSNRLSAIGYAQTKPLAENISNEGRIRNRRVQLMVIANENSNPIDTLSDSLGMASHPNLN